MAVNIDGCDMVAVAVAVQLFESVTVTVYVPAATFEMFALVPSPPLHEYVYDVVPPVAVALNVPVLVPLHVAAVAVADADNADGWFIVAVAVAIHPLLSVTVTL